MDSHAIVVLSKNLTRGNVKTRLAKTVGEEKAYQIYKELLKYTEILLDSISIPRYIFWASKIPSKPDYFSNQAYHHKFQRGENLGERMENAFSEILHLHKKVLIIGTDCPYLKKNHLEEAFASLQTYDYCIGPALDGGYYLLGLKKFSSTWFRNITWSTEKVFSETQRKAREMELKGYVLPVLGDVDVEEDYDRWKSSTKIT
jgi:uncharacterized protein